MGIFSIRKEAKQATELENEVMKRVSKMDDPTKITMENLSLQVFVMESDIKRYSKGKFFAKKMYGDQIDWDMTIRGLEGFIDIYNKVMREGFEKWLDPDFLDKKFDEIKILRDEEKDRYQRNYYTGQLKVIAGLQEGELYYDWTSPFMPINFNPAFVDIIKKRGLL